MDPGTARALMLLPTEFVDPLVILLYQTLIGELIWLLKTRPDFHFTVCLLSRYLKNATQAHLDIALNRPLRFLKQTVNYGIVFYPGNEKWVLSGASDADLAGDLTTARSTLGHYARLGRYGAITARCGLDRRICTATGQAETYAMQALLKDIIWLLRLLSELRHTMTDATILRTDNDGVVKQSTKAINHTTAKHYRIAQAYIRQFCRDGTVKVAGEDTKLNETDIFTKALDAPLFVRHQGEMMGPQSPPI
jgi:hypothetical protein